MLAFYVMLHFAGSIMALAIEVGGKWLVIGRRLAGEYRWDESSYCQRWQIFITLQSIKGLGSSSILDLIEGGYFLVLYFKALGCNIGKNVCLYPNGGDPMMTEPELVTLGEWVSVDDASLICHINTRGDFRLNPLNVGDGCVLKSGSRLSSGANMESHSMLLEHTLVMSGETCDSDTVWQGWPSNFIVPLSRYQNDEKFKCLHLNHNLMHKESQDSESESDASYEIVKSNKRRIVDDRNYRQRWFSWLINSSSFNHENVKQNNHVYSTNK
jgi:carbonic anhydrase/acetyltransferase-like protein (isoleucine patch superfamily)